MFGIKAFDFVIRVDCDSSELRDKLERYLLPPLPRCDGSFTEPDVEIWVRTGAGSFDIVIDGEEASSANSLDDAVLETVKALDEALVRKFKALRAVHAGAVVIEGKALLIPGSTHAGKSALVAELLRRGARLLSDEYALIDEHGRAHAYPRPLLVRNGSVKQSPALPEELGSSYATGAISVAWIFAVGYDPDGRWELSKLSQGETVMLLLKNTPHEMANAPGMVDSFVRVAANAVCYAGRRGDATDAADHILALISGK